ncbi:MAG: Asp-tRNA(Asn)/Glu-tRNA(Gln) amidotransferase subunit GatC [Candidatus Paceibacterota bacterium]|jgi:aspartyl-tRNA(Asn)/glutamyl-tRNA(Gln) amidotransferase subunit C
MATTEEVQKLAALARIKVEDAELEKFTREFDAILAYVETVSTVEISSAEEEKPLLHNVMRADGEPHAAGIYTEKIVEQFPAKEGDALSVKQIL